MTDLSDLGTVLTVWAHPDDETYLAGGLLASLTDAGHRVVCVTATRGEGGGSGLGSAEPGWLGELRTRELVEALAVLGVSEHHWLDYADGGCVGVDRDEAAGRIGAIMDDVRPDTVITFGPEGYTGHPDHATVSSWVDLAVGRSAVTPLLLHAVARPDAGDVELEETFGVFELGRPRLCADDELALLLTLEGELLDRKVRALLTQVSQTGGLVAAVGMARYRAWVADEAFAVPPTP